VKRLSLYEREGISPSSFRTPAIDRLCSGEDLVTCMRSARARMRWAAMVEAELLSLYVQLTADALSQKMAMDWCCRDIGDILSSTSQCRSMPAISRSLMVMTPSGLSLDLKFEIMSVGSCNLHTVGVMLCTPSSQTPPIPVLHASTKPIKAGCCVDSSRMCVGLVDIWCRIDAQSDSACFNGGVMLMNGGVVLIAL